MSDHHISPANPALTRAAHDAGAHKPVKVPGATAASDSTTPPDSTMASGNTATSNTTASGLAAPVLAASSTAAGDRELARTGPVRLTRQRAAVAAILSQHGEFRSAQHLHQDLLARGDSIGLATVYRALQAMADAREVDVLRTDSDEKLYRMCQRSEHHHHLVCRNCGRTEEIDGPMVEQWAQAFGVEHGFTEIDHIVELWGICSACRAG